MKRDTPKQLPSEACPQCWKSPELCLCHEEGGIQARLTKHKILILQHPREIRSPLGTAPLASLFLKNSVHRIGLSWRSLSAALGEPADPRQWAVLYLGTKKKSQSETISNEKPFQVTTPKGKPVDPSSLRGIIILDGNWEQSKTLWWRNPWLLRLARIQLKTEGESLYGKRRRQPRKHCISSLEAAAAALENLGEDQKVSEGLRSLMSQLLVKADSNLSVSL